MWSNLLLAQTPKEIKKMKSSVESYVSVEDYNSAYLILNKLKRISPKDNEVNFLLGFCEMELKRNYSKAITYFESVRTNSVEKDVPLELYRLLGEAYHNNYDFESGIKYFKIYKSLLPQKQSKLLNEIEHKIKIATYANQLFISPVDYKKINLGGAINSNKGDYAPVISADESTLMFTSRRSGGVNADLVEFDNDPYEDIYISHKKSNNEWGEALLMASNINTKLNDATSAITVDGQKLFIYRSNKNGKGGKIYKSYLNGVNWENPVALGGNINSGDWVTSVSISADEHTLYFTSNKKGGLGGRDIYVAYKNDDGTWGNSTNLGSTVNTLYNEESPFIHPDGKTLFFSSKGHNTMGGYDVFKTVFDGAAWSEPENLGYPLNSTKDDLHFVLSANGQNGYYASTGIDSYGKEDIYQIIMPKNNIPLTMIRGTILCADSLKPLDVVIKVRDVETNTFIKHVYKPNPESGKYLIILPPGKNYDMIITTNGYIPYKMNVYIPEQKEFYELYQTIYIKAVHPFDQKLGQGISVDNSFFNNAGSIVDLDEQKKVEGLRQKRLQDLLNNIINQSDSLAMTNLNEVVESNFDDTYKTVNVDTSFSSLLNLVGQVFENTDTTALKHVNNIIERGFYTYAEKNVYFYGDSFIGQSDTIIVNTNEFKMVQPVNYSDTMDFGVGQKNETKTDENSATDTIITLNKVLNQTILFDYKKTNLSIDYLDTLNQLISVFKEYPHLTFSLVGYTDSIGSEAYNIKLSKYRVTSVEKYLLDNGVLPSNITTDSRGEANPIDSNKTEIGRAKNRRVEINLIEKIN